MLHEAGGINWMNIPQWSVESPHHPYCEQHLYEPDAQVAPPLVAPQVPSAETTLLRSSAALFPETGEGTAAARAAVAKARRANQDCIIIVLGVVEI